MKRTALYLAALFVTVGSFQALAKVEAKLKLAPTYYFEDVEKGTSQYLGVVQGSAELSTKVSKNLRLKLSPVIYSDVVSESVSERFIADINEASANLRANDFTFSLGINPIAWGVTDFYNPLDVVSARRYMDLLNSEKRGVPSLDVTWDNGVYRLEGIYVPVQLESIMPGEKSRWLPRDFTYNRSAEFGKLYLGDDFSYLYTKSREYDDALKNNFGFRFERRGDGLDLTAIFFQGAPTAPAILTPIVSGEAISVSPGNEIVVADEITLQPAYYLRRTVGAGAVFTFETAILRLAAAHSTRVTNDETLPGWTNSAVIGLEKNFAIGETTLTTILQATYADNQVQADNTLTSIDRIFDRSWLLGYRWSLSTDWTATGAILYDSKYANSYAQLGFDYRITDGMSASLAGGIFDGRPGTPIGTYRRNDRVSAAFEFFF